MVAYAFDLGIWTMLFFLVGMYKPQWPLFFVKNPNRLMIVGITTIFIMITFTLYGEGTRRDKLAQEAKIVIPKDANAPSSAVPVPVPVPTPLPALVPTPDKAPAAKKFL